MAAVIPAVYLALNFDEQLDRCRTLAGEYTNLRHRFRQAARISSARSLPEFEQEFERLMERLEEANRRGYTAPEWCFRHAQRKIKGGDYVHDELK